MPTKAPVPKKKQRVSCGKRRQGPVGRTGYATGRCVSGLVAPAAVKGPVRTRSLRRIPVPIAKPRAKGTEPQVTPAKGCSTSSSLRAKEQHFVARARCQCAQRSVVDADQPIGIG